MIGTVGDDDFGRVNLERLRRDGVDVSAVMVEPNLPTGTAFVRYNADGRRNFVFNMWTSAAGCLAWTEAVSAVVSRAGHLHVMGTLLGQETLWPLIERAAGAVKARGGTVFHAPASASTKSTPPAPAIASAALMSPATLSPESTDVPR